MKAAQRIALFTRLLEDLDRYIYEQRLLHMPELLGTDDSEPLDVEEAECETNAAETTA